MALGFPLGIPFGIAIGSIAIGPAFGLAIGLAIGSLIEAKYNPNPRPLTPAEQKTRKLFTVLGTVFFLLGIVAFFMFEGGYV